MSWTKLKKKTPPENEYVLVYRLGSYLVLRLVYDEYTDFDEVGNRITRKYKKWYDIYDHVQAVTGYDHWMELPEEPEASK